MVRKEWRSLAGIQNAHDVLPGPDEPLTRSDGSQAFGSDFSEHATIHSAGNLAVIKRLTRVVLNALVVRRIAGRLTAK